MELSLNAPAFLSNSSFSMLDRVESYNNTGNVNLSSDKRDNLEKDIYKMVERWKEGTAQLRNRLRDYNDLMEGVVEEMDFPWPGASKVTMGLSSGMARTMAATFDRSLFSGSDVFVSENISAASRKNARDIENAINWLAINANNMMDVLKGMAIPLFRDGTVPVMGEWDRKIERACDYKTYQASSEFIADYPTPEDAGIDDKKYQQTLDYLDKTIDPNMFVEYTYDEIIYDAPKFTMIPLARFPFYPLSAEDLEDCVMYGRQYFESIDDARTKVRFGEYDKAPTEDAIHAASGLIDDHWGHNREAIEGINSNDDGYERMEMYRIVLKRDMDGDRIPEKYLITYEHRSKKILRVKRYNLRRNIDNVVLFRFIKRDGRLLGVSLCGDGYDQFRMVDDFHRHRQNVRSITDAPAFVCPERLKDSVDFGGGDYAWRPGITIYLPDEYMGDKAPRQIPVQNLDRTNNSMDEEGSVMRYLEIKLGPTQGMSGKETMQDPKQPATKTLALLRQSTFRTDAYISEFKKSVPKLIKLHNALYFQYGPTKLSYMANVKDQAIELELEKSLLAKDALSFNLRIGELALSPEFQLEKAQAILAMALNNPVVAQVKPEVLIEAWNEFVYAVRPLSPERFLIDKDQLGAGSGGFPPPAPQGAVQQLPQILAQKMQEMRAMGELQGADKNKRPSR